MEDNQEVIDALEALQDVTVRLEQTKRLRATVFMAAMISSPNATAAELRDLDGLARRAVDYAKALQNAERKGAR